MLLKKHVIKNNNNFDRMLFIPANFYTICEQSNCIYAANPNTILKFRSRSEKSMCAVCSIIRRKYTINKPREYIQFVYVPSRKINKK